MQFGAATWRNHDIEAQLLLYSILVANSCDARKTFRSNVKMFQFKYFSNFNYLKVESTPISDERCSSNISYGKLSKSYHIRSLNMRNIQILWVKYYNNYNMLLMHSKIEHLECIKSLAEPVRNRPWKWKPRSVERHQACQIGQRIHSKLLI